MTPRRRDTPSRGRWLLAALLTLALVTAGCVGGEVEETSTEDDDVTGFDEATRERAESQATERPLDYVVPGTEVRPHERIWINGSVGPEAVQGAETSQDRGGTSYNTVVLTEDIADHIPPGQAVQVDLTLIYDGAPGRSADLDILVDFPHLVNSTSRAYWDEYSWVTVRKTAQANVVGVEGEPHEVGIEVSEGRILPGQSLDYSLRVDLRYAPDAVGPHVPYAFDVPANASGLVLSSVKLTGDTHVDTHIVLVGPDDELLRSVPYNDLAIASESILIPVDQAGEHVLYATHMTGGFLAVEADAPPDDREMRILDREVTREVLFEGGVAPGVAEHHVYDETTPRSGGESTTFTLGETFPLEVRAFVGGEGATVAGDVEVRLSSEKGLVDLYHRFARYDDERGSVGASDDGIPENDRFLPENLAPGTYTAEVIMDGTNAPVGYEVVTYVR